MIFLRNVLRARLRSFVTVLGIAGGVALYVAITAITTDLQKQISEAVGAYNLEVVVYEKRATSPFSSHIAQQQMDALVRRYGAALTPLVLGTLNERWNAYAMVIGASSGFVRRIPLVAGVAFDAGSRQAMLGEIAAQRLGLQVGHNITLDGYDYRISGIFRTGSRLFDGAAMADIPLVQKMLTRAGEEPHYTLALLQTADRGTKERLVREIPTHFPSLKAIAGTEFAGSLRLLKVVDAFVNTISVIALVGICLIVTNTLLMAISERIREIGILMTIGWSAWLVIRMFLAESLLLCGVGALVGNGLALLLLRTLNGLESVGFGWIPVRMSPELVLASIGLSLAIALLSLIWPTFVLWRMQPLTALRHE